MTNPLAESILYIEASNVPNKELVLSLLGRHSHIDYVFSPTDTGFLIGTMEETHVFRNYDGLRHIHTLLETPNSQIHSLALYSPMVDLELPLEDMPVGDEGFSMFGHHDILDTQSIKEFKRELGEIKKRLKEELDDDERESLLGQRVWLAGAVANDRQVFSDPSERARKAVSRNIKRALERIEEKSPEIATEIRRGLTTGEYFEYRQDKKVFWDLEKVAIQPKR